MKFLLVLSILTTLTSCHKEEEKKTSVPSDLKKTETIMAADKTIKGIALNNPAGKITVSIGEKVSAKYEKKKWREWCLLNHIEKSGTLKLQVENTSITGEGGCEVYWHLTLPSAGHLRLNQAAGMINGEGAVASLKIQQAAGDLQWKQGNMSLEIQVAAGSVRLENMSFPSEGESSIEVGTGLISITSPRGTKVTTQTSSAIGKQDNDFSDKEKGHLLKLKVAVGKLSHKEI